MKKRVIKFYIALLIFVLILITIRIAYPMENANNRTGSAINIQKDYASSFKISINEIKNSKGDIKAHYSIINNLEDEQIINIKYSFFKNSILNEGKQEVSLSSNSNNEYIISIPKKEEIYGDYKLILLASNGKESQSETKQISIDEKSITSRVVDSSSSVWDKISMTISILLVIILLAIIFLTLEKRPRRIMSSYSQKRNLIKLDLNS